MQSGMVISLLFLCTSQQIGSTYGGFSDAVQTEQDISFCAVFPNSIKQQLLQFKGHVTAAAALALSLQDYSFSQGYSGIPSIEGMSLEELDSAEQQLSGQLTVLHSELDQVTAQLTANIQTWNELIAEVNAAAADLAVIGGYMNNLDPNCLEITDEQFFNEFQSSLNQSGVLSESLSASLNGIMQYLQSLQNPGAPYALSVSGAVYGPLGFNDELTVQPFPFLMAVSQPDGNISGSLISTYDALNSSLLSLKDSAAASIAELESQRQLIGETRTVRLEEMEKARLAAIEEAKKAEEARLALEKQQEAEAQAKPDDVTQPEATEDATATATASAPAASEQPVPTATAAPDTSEATEAPAGEPQATATPTPDPAPSPEPADSQQVKGGD